MPHIHFGLVIKPISFFGYKDGDELTLRFDLTTAPAEITADIYLLLMNPDGKFFPGLTWDKGLQPLVKNFALPADLDIDGAPLVTFTIPSEKPPVDEPGTYTFYLAALKPGTLDFISNIASTSFDVK